MSIPADATWQTNFIGKSNWANDPSFKGSIRSLRMFAGDFTPTAVGSFNYKTVTYDATGGTSPITAITSGKLALPDATRTGYQFQGWFDATPHTSATLLGLATAEYTPTISTTVYAGWVGNEYSYNANTGSGSTPADQTYAGPTLLAAANTFTPPTGYSFGGWCTSQPSVGAVCGGTSYQSTASLPVPFLEFL
jgi:hypothetical protein